GENGGLNLYGFVGNNGLGNFDFLGLDWNWWVEGFKHNARSATATVVSASAKGANATIHGVAQAGGLLDVTWREVAVYCDNDIDVDLEAAYDRLNAITNHLESYEAEIEVSAEILTGGT